MVVVQSASFPKPGAKLYLEFKSVPFVDLPSTQYFDQYIPNADRAATISLCLFIFFVYAFI